MKIKKNYCLVCGIEITKNSEICHSCFYRPEIERGKDEFVCNKIDKNFKLWAKTMIIANINFGSRIIIKTKYQIDTLSKMRKLLDLIESMEVKNDKN